MCLFDSTLEDSGEYQKFDIQGKIQGYLKTESIFAGTELDNIDLLNPAAKGSCGESIVEDVFTSRGSIVLPRQKGQKGHDRQIDDITTEIKISTMPENNITINHVSLGKKFDRFLFCYPQPRHPSLFKIPDDFYEGVNLRFWWTTHTLLEKVISEYGPCICHQQAGAEVGNDDFTIQGSLNRILGLNIWNDISEW